MRFIKNLALYLVIQDLDLRGTATKRKLSKEDRDEAMSRVWMNKDFISIMKDWVVRDVERSFYETEERKMHFKRGEALRTYKIMQVLQAAHKRHTKRVSNEAKTRDRDRKG